MLWICVAMSAFLYVSVRTLEKAYRKKHLSAGQKSALLLLLAVGAIGLLIRLCLAAMSPMRLVPVFSHDSGFYEESFALTISAEKGISVYYTLDGSAPTRESALYEGPIEICDASGNPNVWSMRQDVSAGFLEEDVAQAGGETSGYAAPDYPIDKCTIVRAMCATQDGKEGEAYTASYFVGFERKEGYEGMNVLSLVADPADLFDHEKGIYVTGDVYEASENEGSKWWGWDANYSQRGREWEREAFLQFFDADGRLLLSKDAGVRIQGGGSRGRLPRSLNLYARKEYDGDSRFEADFFDSGFLPQRMTLFAGADDTLLKMKDYLMASILRERGFSTMEFEPYVMFLNGEYWGVYWLTEKYDEEYFSYHYDVDDDNVVMIKNGELGVGKEEDMELYEEMRAFISEADMSIEENYRQACALVDIDSLLEYYAAEIYIANFDWPQNNVALWRTRDVERGIYGDGRWRWCLFDVNHGTIMKAERAEIDALTVAMGMDPLFAGLMENEGFRCRFADTILDMAGKEFLPEKIDIFIAAFRERMARAMEKEYERFYGRDSSRLADFESGLEEASVFFRRRYEYITEYFRDDFSLSYGDWRERIHFSLAHGD